VGEGKKKERFNRPCEGSIRAASSRRFANEFKGRKGRIKRGKRKEASWSALRGSGRRSVLAHPRLEGRWKRLLRKKNKENGDGANIRKGGVRKRERGLPCLW